MSYGLVVNYFTKSKIPAHKENGIFDSRDYQKM